MQVNSILVYTENGCSDTLFTQDCCALPTGVLRVSDISALTMTATEINTAFQGYMFSAGNIRYIVVENKTLLIEGQVDLDEYSEEYKIEFKDCHIYMGAGAVMYGQYYIFQNSTVEGLCSMWKGIYVGDHGTVEATNSNFRDAEYCITVRNQELRVKFRNSTFSRNFVSLYAPPYNPNSFYYSIDPTDNSFIEECHYDGSPSITLPLYHGQSGIPMGGKSFAGMLLHNIRIPVLGSSSFDRIFLIPFSNDAAYKTRFSNLQYGIFGVNSNLEVMNCVFTNIQPESAYNPRRGSNPGTAIYSTVRIGTPVKILKVGEENDAALHLNYQNEFNNCRRGIVTINGVNSYINYNSFLHPANSTTESGTGIYLKDADLRQISISNNTFTEENINLSGTYSSTSIVVSSLMPTYKNLMIKENTFVNERIGVYLQNSRGRRYSDMGFMVTDNIFVTDVAPNELTSYQGIFGIWLNNVSNGMVRYNQFYRPHDLSQAPSNFETMLYGMNVVGSTGLNIAGNDFTQFGTSMRMVSNCAGTTLKCNHFISNVQGVSLAQASMTDQGWPGEAWDNKWDGFPTTSSSSYNRVNGTSTSTVPIKWYNQGQLNTVSNDNRFSPQPVDGNIIHPNPYTQETGCYYTTSYTGGSGGSAYRIHKIMEGDIEYYSFPEETKYLDQEFAFQVLSEDSLLQELELSYQDYYDSLAQGELGQFEDVDSLYLDGEMTNALQELGFIIDTNIITYNKVFTREIFLQQKESSEEELEPEIEDELHNIAWTNAWEGGSGVFGARHLLEELVFDVQNNLRKRNLMANKKIESSRVFSIYPNPANESVTLFHNVEENANLSVRVFDIAGRMLLEYSMNGNKLNVQGLGEGVYVLHFYVNQEFSSMAKLTVLR